MTASNPGPTCSGRTLIGHYYHSEKAILVSHQNPLQLCKQVEVIWPPTLKRWLVATRSAGFARTATSVHVHTSPQAPLNQSKAPPPLHQAKVSSPQHSAGNAIIQTKLSWIIHMVTLSNPNLSESMSRVLVVILDFSENGISGHMEGP